MRDWAGGISASTSSRLGRAQVLILACCVCFEQLTYGLAFRSGILINPDHTSSSSQSALLCIPSPSISLLHVSDTLWKVFSASLSFISHTEQYGRGELTPFRWEGILFAFRSDNHLASGISTRSEVKMDQRLAIFQARLFADLPNRTSSLSFQESKSEEAQNIPRSKTMGPEFCNICSPTAGTKRTLFFFKSIRDEFDETYKIVSSIEEGGFVIILSQSISSLP